ncbi:MAG: hypothetical protein LBS46_07410 [Dysgonamonadaceae bacterium]|jgi:hypothetical protein|nr:hypothetical protein [Dysgonamonadaceae bacterium]
MTKSNREIGRWLDDNCLIVCIFISTAFLIFVQSYWLNTYISPDSTHYLRAAQSLLNGHGLYVNTAAGDTATYFSMWPIGYPAMIALVSLVTGAEVYLASKILSVIFLAILCTLFYFRFKKTAWVYALIVTNFGFLQIFWYTWSEQPFILGLVWISFAIMDIVASKRIQFRHYISLCLASLFLFFSRYIGTFSIGVIGLLAGYYLIAGISKAKKEYIKKSVLLIGAALIAATVIIAYLYINKTKGGYITGMERIPTVEHPLRVFMLLCISSLMEIRNVFYSFFAMNYGLLITLSVVGCFLLFRFRTKIKRYFSVQAVCFLSIGFLYWCSIVVMRFSAAFDGFDFRLLFPASGLLFLGIVSLILNYRSAWVKKINSTCIKYVLLICISASLFSYSLPEVYSVVKRFYKQEGGITGFNKIHTGIIQELSFYKQEVGINGYRKIRADIIQELSSVPEKSLVITNWGSKKSYLSFIRPDLFTTHSIWPLPIELHSKMEQVERVYIYFDWEQLPWDDAFFSPYRESNERVIQIK